MSENILNLFSEAKFAQSEQSRPTEMQLQQQQHQQANEAILKNPIEKQFTMRLSGELAENNSMGGPQFLRYVILVFSSSSSRDNIRNIFLLCILAHKNTRKQIHIIMKINDIHFMPTQGNCEK